MHGEGLLRRGEEVYRELLTRYFARKIRALEKDPSFDHFGGDRCMVEGHTETRVLTTVEFFRICEPLRSVGALPRSVWVDEGVPGFVCLHGARRTEEAGGWLCAW